MIPGLNKRALNFYDLMLYVALVRKHLRLMVLLICMCLLFGVVFYVYSRSVSIPGALCRSSCWATPMDSDAVYHDGNLSSVLTELKSPDVIERTAARFGVKAGHTEIDLRYLRALKIEPNGGGNLEVEVWSYVPAWPANWTEVMVEEFMKLRVERREKYRETVMKTYGEDLNQISAKIDSNQESNNSFQDDAKFTQASIDVTRLRDLPLQLAKSKQRLDQLDDVRKRLDAAGIDTIARLSLIASTDTDSPVRIGEAVSVPVSNGAGGPGPASGAGAGMESVATNSVVVPGLVAETLEWQGLEKQEREILKEKAQLSLTYLPGNQKMLAVDKELDQVERSLKIDYDVARMRFDFVCESLRDQYADLQKKLPEYEAANRKYTKIQQNQQLHEAGQLKWNTLYGDAAKLISELEFTADKEKVNLRYDHMIELRDSQISPSKITVGLIAFLAGLLMAFGVPFLIEYLDYTLTNIEEVEATFQMRGLGIIPQVTFDHGQPVLLDLSADGDERNLVENFRVVRTNLLAMGTLEQVPSGHHDHQLHAQGG